LLWFALRNHTASAAPGIPTHHGVMPPILHLI